MPGFFFTSVVCRSIATCADWYAQFYEDPTFTLAVCFSFCSSVLPSTRSPTSATVHPTCCSRELATCNPHQTCKVPTGAQNSAQHLVPQYSNEDSLLGNQIVLLPDILEGHIVHAYSRKSSIQLLNFLLSILYSF